MTTSHQHYLNILANSKNIVVMVFKKLLTSYGFQGWWPTCSSFEKKLGNNIDTESPQYRPDNPFRSLTPQEKFEICIGAILTQNTSWTNVAKVIPLIKKIQLLNEKKLNQIDLDSLAKHIKPTGYYNQKARKIKAFAQYITENPLEQIFKLSIPDLRKTLLKLHGIGPETADDIILYAAQKPVFVIDTYTKRIFSRLGFCQENISYYDLQTLIMKNLPLNAPLFNEYHALLVKLAKHHCQTKPKCTHCPLFSLCKKN